jgi:hypothetical protein
MAQFDEMKKELGVFIEGVNSELLSLEGRLKSFTVDTRGINASFDLLTAELLRVAILFEGVAQKIQGYTNIEEKAANQFADDLETAGNSTKETLDKIDEDIVNFGSTINTTDSNINTFGRNVDDTAKKTEIFGDNFANMGDDIGSSADGLTNQFTTTTDAFKNETIKFSDGFNNVFDNVKKSSDDLSNSLNKITKAYVDEKFKTEDITDSIKKYGEQFSDKFYAEKPQKPKSSEPFITSVIDTKEDAKKLEKETDSSWIEQVLDEVHKSFDEVNKAFKDQSDKIETINISEILKEYSDKIKAAADEISATPSGPTKPPDPPKYTPTPSGGGDEWTNENNEKPKPKKGAGMFESMAVASDTVGKILGNFGQNIYQVQNTLLGAGRTFDLLQKSAIGLATDLAKAAFAAAFFVNAFNPALVQQFTYNLRDLQAVIGTALVPVLNAFALEIRFLADTLLPVFQSLQPAFQELGNAIIGFLTPIIKQIGSSLLTLANTINNLLGPAITKFVSSFGELFAELMRQLTPVINTLVKFFSTLLIAVSYVANILKAFAPLLVAAFTGLIVMISVNAITALGVFIASVWAASNTLTLGLATLIGGIVSFISWLTTKEEEASSGLTGISEGLAARRAEYSTPEELSRNLIKAAFGGANTDRLKNIDANGKRQVELLEIIANKKNPAGGIGINALRNEAGQKPGFLDIVKRAIQFGPNPQAVGL